MKRLFIPALIGLSAMTLLTGCLSIQLGGGTTSRTESITVGQQLIDLQKAKEAGAITDAEYQAQKAKLLNSK
jgi:Short C-terminal domain